MPVSPCKEWEEAGKVLRKVYPSVEPGVGDFRYPRTLVQRSLPLTHLPLIGHHLLCVQVCFWVLSNLASHLIPPAIPGGG